MSVTLGTIFNPGNW